ncbi:hypothetical protein AJ80_00919 [Polytolypa hystricis UAMH7299]|uniref:RNA polymerase II degradation factor 1 n=1 Tax=Polytolypa hystricis (strain UAMH7299) TaxID=1447883 RepID=A0A2B7Z274_POLH7|nr:hypothetical protein AJ80_00919 [Polytolypa hystricis UAMH7299]
MSEFESRSMGTRGRGSARGGRGGYSSRGGRAGNRVTKSDIETTPSYEDEGELGQLKKKYATSLPTIKELFPDWTDEDLIFALEDADGDLEIAIDRITEGNVSQWGEVKKKHTDRSKTKAKEAQAAQADATAAQASRGGRGRGGFDTRGRARGDRGRGGRGGRAGAHVNGTRSDKPSGPAADAVEPSTAQPETSAAENPIAEAAVSTDSVPSQIAKEPVALQTTTVPEPAKKGSSWASLFDKPAPLPVQKQPPPPAVVPEKPIEAPVEKAVEPAPQPEPVPEEEPAAAPAETVEVPVPEPVIPTIPKEEPALPIVEKVPEVAPAQPPTTAAPAVASIQEQSNVLSGAAAQPRPAIPNYGAGAYKPATTTTRPPGLQRRVLDQQEAVVMPGNHAVDRAAVQFGSMGLNGPVEDADIDEEREEPETRAQPPQHSPVAPRASLPPSTQAQVQPEPVAVPRAAPGLPPAPPASAAEAAFNDFARYTEAQKPYDPFSQQIEQPQPQTQEPFSNQAPIPSQPTTTTGADYASFYGADQSRNPYYYGSYGQPQDAGAQQRAASQFSVTGAEVQPQFASTQPPTRYGGQAEAPGSGHNTPNPTLPQTQQAQPAQHMPQGQAGYGGHSYGYPYYSSPHYATTYMNAQHQYGRNRPMYDDARRYEEQYLHNNQFGYGNQFAPYGKAGMYGQPQHGFSYDHTSSPANAAGFTQAVPGRESSYGRTGSAQPAEGQQSTGGHSAFAGIPDVFGRGQSGFGQTQPITQQQPASIEEASKGFEAPKAGGPSPSLAQANRPGSATNSAPGQPQAGQTGLPPVQGQQQAFGGYPHLNPQYSGVGGVGGVGGLGGHHQAGANQTHHQGSGYGSYGAGFGSNYYGNTGRGGWGGSYGH